MTLPAKEATITGAYGDTDYEASLAGSDGNGKISLQADTTIENLNFSFGNASQLENKNHKLITRYRNIRSRRDGLQNALSVSAPL